MQILPIDERDDLWISDSPRFRLFFYIYNGENSTHGASEVFELTDCDVIDVIEYAERRAGSKMTYALALIDDRSGAPEFSAKLTWLVGTDGNDDGDSSVLTAKAQARMLALREGRGGGQASELPR